MCVCVCGGGGGGRDGLGLMKAALVPRATVPDAPTLRCSSYTRGHQTPNSMLFHSLLSYINIIVIVAGLHLFH